MTTVRPDIAETLGFARTPDLPPHVVALIEAIGERVVSPDIPAPLKRTAVSVARSVVGFSTRDDVVRDAADTLGHLKYALGEIAPEAPARPAPAPAMQDELRITLGHAEARGDLEAVQVIQAALGMAASPQPPDLLQ